MATTSCCCCCSRRLLLLQLFGLALFASAAAQTFFLSSDNELLWNSYAYATSGNAFIDLSSDDGFITSIPLESRALRIDYQSWGAFGLSSLSAFDDTTEFKVEFWMAANSNKFLLGSDVRSLGQVDDTAYYQLEYIPDGSWQKLEVDLEAAFGKGEWKIVEWRNFGVEFVALYLDGIRIRRDASSDFQLSQAPYASVNCYYTLHATNVPALGEAGLLTGYVQAPSGEEGSAFPFKVALYIFVESFGWVSKPTLADPYQDVAEDGSWSANYATSGNDVSAEILAVYLVKDSAVSDLPILNGQEDFPEAALRDISVAYLYITRGQRAEVFSGAAYLKKQGYTGPGPGNLWTSSPEVAFTEESVFDEESGEWATGSLHLGIEYLCEPECGWYCTEYEGVQTYGYGRYHWAVKGRVDQLDPSAVLGLFTYETPTQEEINDPLWGERELDIEFSQFEGPQVPFNDNNNAQFVVQPWDSAFLQRLYIGLSSDEDVLHCIIDWQSGQVNFAIYLVEEGSSQPILVSEQSYSGDAVPTTNAERINMNLWIAKWTLFSDAQVFDPVPPDFFTSTESNLKAEILSFQFTPVSGDDSVLFPKPINPGSCQSSGSNTVCVASGVFTSNDESASQDSCEQAFSPPSPLPPPPSPPPPLPPPPGPPPSSPPLLQPSPSPPGPPTDLSDLMQIDIVADGKFLNSFSSVGIGQLPVLGDNGVLASLDGVFFISENIYNTTGGWLSMEYEILPPQGDTQEDAIDVNAFVFLALQPIDFGPIISFGIIVALQDYTTSGVAQIPLDDLGVDKFNEIIISDFDFDNGYQIRIESMTVYSKYSLSCEDEPLPDFILTGCGGREIVRLPCSKFSNSYQGTSASECIVGTEYADTIKAGEGSDVIFGLQGDDDINGGGGKDVVFGGLGNDQIRGGNGADRLYGGPGVDTIFGGKQKDTLVGGTGKDLLNGGIGKDSYVGCEVLNNSPHDTFQGFNSNQDVAIATDSC